MKKYSRLTFQQRIVIAFMVKNKYSKNKIALELGVHPSTIGRELKRNASERGTYNFTFAEGFARDRKESKKRSIKFTEDVRAFVDRKLRRQWSPDQISGYCKANGIEMVSHERIYQYVYEDKQQGGDLWKNLRTQVRKRKNRNRKRDNRFIVNKRKLSERPVEANDRLKYGDWEIDLICGGFHQGFAVTAVERKSGFSLIHKIDNRKSLTVKKAVINLLSPYRDYVHTITSDNGSEFVEHETISSKLEADYFFCDPYSSWQRGLNEYTNKLYRQYIPKRSNIKLIDTKDIISFQTSINTRPRKKLGYKTPSEVFLSIFET